MLKRLVDLMGAAEAGRRTGGAGGEPGADARRTHGAAAHRGPIGQRNAHDFGAVYAYTISGA